MEIQKSLNNLGKYNSHYCFYVVSPQIACECIDLTMEISHQIIQCHNFNAFFLSQVHNFLLSLSFSLYTSLFDQFCLPICLSLCLSVPMSCSPPLSNKSHLVQFPLFDPSLLWFLVQFHLCFGILASLSIYGILYVLTVHGRPYVHLSSYVRNTASLCHQPPLGLQPSCFLFPQTFEA